jgi:hypothetical protein
VQLGAQAAAPTGAAGLAGAVVAAGCAGAGVAAGAQAATKERTTNTMNKTFDTFIFLSFCGSYWIGSFSEAHFPGKKCDNLVYTLYLNPAKVNKSFWECGEIYIVYPFRKHTLLHERWISFGRS